MFSASLAYAEQASYYNFAGGLNNKTASILIADNEASDLQNVMFTETGAITKRTGYTTLISTPVVAGHTVTSIYDYEQNDGDRYLIVTSSGYIKKLNAAGNDWDTLLSTMTTVTGTDFYDYCVYPASGSICIITNGQDKIQKYLGGANTTDLGTGTDPDDWRPNLAEYCETWDYRLWLANITDANGGVTDTVVQNRIRYSSALGCTSIEGSGAWPPLFYFDIADSRVTGIAKLIDSNDINDYRQKLIVFGPNSISVIGGTYSSSTNYNLKKIVDGKGTLSNRTIKTADNILIFQDKSGDVYSFDGSAVKLLSEKIQTTINGLNKQYLGIACAVVYPKYHQYWLAVPNGASTTNDLVLVYDYLTGAWTKYTGITTSDFAIIGSAGKQYLYSGDNTSSGYVFKQDTGNNDKGNNISSYYVSKNFSILSPSQEKQIDSIYLTATQGTGFYSLNVWTNFNFGKISDFQTFIFGSATSETWTLRGPTGEWFKTAISKSGKYQMAGQDNGYLYLSSDYGVTWSSGTIYGEWRAMDMSNDGKYQTAGIYNSYLHTSSDYGVTWTTTTSTGLFEEIRLSADGKYQVASKNSGNLINSADYGATWNWRVPSGTLDSLAMSADGKYQTTCRSGGYLFKSSDYGVTWIYELSKNWNSVAMSIDGKYQSAVCAYLYTSSDYGGTWTERSSYTGSKIIMSNDGRFQSMTSVNSFPMTSFDYGVTWTAKTTNNSVNWESLAMSIDGKYRVASNYVDNIYSSSDYGINWTRTSQPGNTYSVAMSADGKYQTSGIYTGNLYSSSDYGGEPYWAATTKKISLNKSTNFVNFTFNVIGTVPFTLYGFTIKYFPIELK